MKRRLLMRGLWLSLTASLIGGLLVLDHFRGGPSSQLSRCNLLLSKSESPPITKLEFQEALTLLQARQSYC